MLQCSPTKTLSRVSRLPWRSFVVGCVMWLLSMPQSSATLAQSANHNRFDKEGDSSFIAGTRSEFASVPNWAQSLTLSIQDSDQPQDLLSLSRFTKLRHLTLAVEDLGQRDLPFAFATAPTTLETVRISVSTLQSPGGLARIAEAKGITNLVLECSEAAGSAILELGRFEQLRHLTLRVDLMRPDRSRGRAEGSEVISPVACQELLLAISKLPLVESLHLDVPHMSVSGAAAIAQSKTLRGFSSTRANDAWIELFSTAGTPLEELRLSRNYFVTDVGIAFVHRLPLLRRLYLDGCHEVGDYAIPSLVKCKGLEVLDLSAGSWDHTISSYDWARKYSPVKDHDRMFRLWHEDRLEEIGQIQSLRSLAMRAIPTLNRRILRSIISRLPNLRELDLSGAVRYSTDTLPVPAPKYHCFFGEGGLDFLEESKLEVLKLNAVARLYTKGWGGEMRVGPVDEELLGAISRMSTLRQLELFFCPKVPLPSLQAIFKMKSLTRIDLLYAGLPENWNVLLPDMRRMKSLAVTTGDPRFLEHLFAEPTDLETLEVSGFGPTELGLRLALMHTREVLDLRGCTAVTLDMIAAAVPERVPREFWFTGGTLSNQDRLKLEQGRTWSVVCTR